MIPDGILDWAVQCWASSDWDRDCHVEFVCDFYQEKSAKDRRCTSGIRVWQEPCRYRFPCWETLRELIQEIGLHVRTAHPGEYETLVTSPGS